MLDLIKLFYEQPSWFAISRFRIPIVLMVAGLFLQLTPVSGAGWVGFALILISAGWGWRQTSLLPNENRRINQVKVYLDHLEIEKAKEVIKKKTFINTAPFNIQQSMFLARCCFKEGDWLGAYAAIQEPGRHNLLPKESAEYFELKGLLYFNLCNCRDFLSLLGKGGNQLPAHCSKKGTALLKSHWHEFQGDLTSAKAELETAIAAIQEVRENILLYNNLARLEGFSGNFQEQIFYLAKAAMLLKDNPVAAYNPLVYHNLSINLAREGRKSEAIQVINDYYAATDRNNILQYLNYANDYLILARELNDQEMIDQAHNHNAELLSMQLTRNQQISLRVSLLRMKRNDRQQTPSYLPEVEALVNDTKTLSDKEQIIALLEIANDLVFELEDCHAGRSRIDPYLLHEFYTSVVRRVLAFHTVIDRELQEIPPALPLVREQWMKRRHNIFKLGMGLKENFSAANFGKMFDNLEEMVRLWRDKLYYSAEIDACLIICDEFVAYRRGLGTRFHQDFIHRAVSAYKAAEALLLKRLERPEFQSQMIGMAYYALHLGMGKDAVAFWFTHASRRGVQLRHYAAW
ncbi:MAG: hypothetical protein K9K82_06840, partial [Desulfobacteraceae bacterium]|nr:hypothetical protein [Desulfobacteraceae bacterium]